MERVAVLLSTYNGEKYLREQLDSLINQSNTKVRIFIRDDGSSDSTTDILNEYSDKFESIVFVNKGKNENLGVKDSYLFLLKHVVENYPEFKYFSFSDQDDVWKKDKLSAALNLLIKEENTPCLYFSNKTFVDSELNLIKRENIHFYNDFMEFFWPSLCFGCTMVINRKLAEIALLKKPEIECIHDNWVYRVAKSVGAKIIFDNKSHILYRQHENNVCGIEATKTTHDNKYMIAHFFSNMGSADAHPIYDFGKEIKHGYYKYLTKESKYYLDLITDYYKSPSKKIRLVFDKEIRRRTTKLKLIWAYKILFNRI